MKQFTINRSKWACGGQGGDSALLNSEGNMCCLGFYVRACGFKEKDIKELQNPWQVSDPNKRFLAEVKEEDSNQNTPWTNLAVLINDNTKLSNATREQMLESHFESIGVKVKFIGKYIMSPIEGE